MEQAQLYDKAHCRHGSTGILWLVRLRNPRGYRPTYRMRREVKLLGTSYTVLRRLGPLGTADPRTINALLKGKKPPLS